MKNILGNLSIILLTMICSCTVPSSNEHNQKLQLTQSALSQAISLKGSDENGEESSGVYGRNITVNFAINVDALHLPVGTKINITPEFSKQGTDVPNNMDWHFEDGSKSINTEVGTQSTINENLLINVVPSKSYYYHNFTVKANVMINGSKFANEQVINIYLFGLIDKRGVNKLYYGEYDNTNKEYVMPVVTSYPNIQDDGSMIINKHINQRIETILYGDNHLESWVGSPIFNGVCAAGADVVGLGEFVTGYSPLKQKATDSDSWKNLGITVGKRLCKKSGNNQEEWFVGTSRGLSLLYRDAFDELISVVNQVSSNGEYLILNGRSFYQVSSQRVVKLYNPDSVPFNSINKTDDYVSGISNSGVILASDMRVNTITHVPNNNWMICGVMVKECVNILHSNGDISPFAGTISASGELLYLFTKDSGANVLNLIVRTVSDKPVAIKLPSALGIDHAKIVNMTATDSGVLTIQYAITNGNSSKLNTVIYSHKFNKWLDATTIVKYLGLSNYLTDNSFHGIMSISPTGMALGLYITANDDFSPEQIKPIAIASYVFGKDYLPEYSSIDDMVNSLGYFVG